MQSQTVGVALALALTSCAVSIEAPDDQPDGADRAPAVADAGAPTIQCDRGSQLAVHETFAHEADRWPGAWLAAGTGETWVEDRGGMLVAGPSKEIRMTIQAPLAITDLRVRFAFSPNEPQAAAITYHGAGAADGFAIRARHAFGGAGDSTMQWTLVSSEGAAELAPSTVPRGGRDASTWLRVRIDRDHFPASARVHAWFADDAEPTSWDRRRLAALAPVGTFSIGASMDEAAWSPEALRIEEVVICTAQ